jgi:N-acetylmuramoyl-L-alanine amidase
MKQVEKPSPNHNGRDGAPIDMLVLHYTGMKSGAAAMDRLCSPAAGVSAHYTIDEDGTVYAHVPEARRAWHAGVSHWAGVDNVNSRSIGIELVNPGHEYGYRAFPEAQIASLIELCTGILSRHPIPPARVLGHSDVAPSRKEDPGELFPWRRLALAGHGLWAEPEAAPGRALSLGDDGPGVFILQAGLARLGYEIPPSGQFDEATATNLRAFQRHWRPALIDGAADGETRARLMALLRQDADMAG